MLVLVVEHVDEVDEALLCGDRAVLQIGQLVDDPGVEASAQFQVIHHRCGVLTDVAERKADRAFISHACQQLACSHRQFDRRAIQCR
ncbi:hypothetical protein D3C81_1790030 [compost metagenome]